MFLGSYTAGPSGAHPEPVAWLKATDENVFIAEHTIDRLQYDFAERSPDDGSLHYNISWTLSNINLWLNSEDDDWWHRTHQYDTPPFYRERPGFLSGMASYELDALIAFSYGVEGRASVVRLPRVEEVIGVGPDPKPRFKPFRRRGVRSHPSIDLLAHKGVNYGYKSQSSYADYLTMPHDGMLQKVGRGGWLETAYPSAYEGVRPVICIDGNAELVGACYGSVTGWSIGELGEHIQDIVVTDEDINDFFGF